jgi:hypothetical protein
MNVMLQVILESATFGVYSFKFLFLLCMVLCLTLNVKKLMHIDKLVRSMKFNVVT